MHFPTQGMTDCLISGMLVYRVPSYKSYRFTPPPASSLTSPISDIVRGSSKVTAGPFNIFRVMREQTHF